MTPSSLSTLRSEGVSVVPYSGPAFRVSRGWVLAPLILLVGTVLIAARAESQGRDAPLLLAIVIYLAVGTFVVAVIVRQIRRLRSIEQRGLTLLGWTCGSTKAIAALSGHGSRGWRSAIGSPVVGVYLSDRGALFVLVDQSDVGLVEASQLAQASIGYRGKRRWVILDDGEGRIALRFWRHEIR